MVYRHECVELPLLAFAIRALTVTVVLIFSSFVFADELVLSALILVTITLITVTLLIGPSDQQEPASQVPTDGTDAG